MLGRRHLLEAFVEFAEYVALVEHLAVESMLVVVGDALAQVSRQFPIRHVLLDLLELSARTTAFDIVSISGCHQPSKSQIPLR